MNKINNVKLKFKLTSLEPTLVPYWKSVFVPENLEVVVELPFHKDYIYNFEQIAMQGIVEGQATEKPILTLKGYKNVLKQLQDISYNTEIETDIDWSNYEPNRIEQPTTEREVSTLRDDLQNIDWEE